MPEKPAAPKSLTLREYYARWIETGRRRSCALRPLDRTAPRSNPSSCLRWATRCFSDAIVDAVLVKPDARASEEEMLARLRLTLSAGTASSPSQPKDKT